MNPTFKIDKNIPIAPRCAGVTDIVKLMEIGDSVFFDGVARSSFYSIASRMKPKKFAVRKLTDGYRLWRVA